MILYQNKPLVSICVPTYNSGRFLEKSLESIVQQDYPDFEVIVSDNASTDNTEDIVKSFGDKLQFRKNPTNLGCYQNYNECLKVVTGEFVAFYHANDIYEPGMVREEVGFLQSHPEAGAVFTLDRLIDEYDNITGEGVLPKELIEKEIYSFVDIYKSLLKNGSTFLICPTFMARRSIFEKTGLFNEKVFKSAADTAQWLTILENYPIGILKERLIKRRIGKSQGSYQYHYLRTERSDYFFVMDAFAKSKSLDGISIEKNILRNYENQKRADDLYIARNLLMKGEISKSKKVLMRSFPPDIFISAFENSEALKHLLIRIVLFIGISIGVGRSILRILHMVWHSIFFKRQK